MSAVQLNRLLNSSPKHFDESHLSDDSIDKKVAAAKNADCQPQSILRDCAAACTENRSEETLARLERSHLLAQKKKKRNVGAATSPMTQLDLARND